MEKKKLNNLSIILIVIIILLIVIPSVKSILDNHYNSLYLVINKKVIEAAEKCHNEGKCDNNKITLKELLDKEYIEKIYDPISKELINLDSYIDLETKEFKIVE